ncbi:MAG TPA: GNAT family N-acetyltransferase [Flavobacteriales bacterium]|nr:GNAT family N-acetyltransferase [Flavobacteriales bacterium]
MEILKTNQLTPLQAQQVHELWNREYPVKLANRFSLLLEGVTRFNHYLIEDGAKNVLAWAVDFDKDGETRFSIIVNTAHQQKGLGSLLVETLKRENHEFFGWVIDHNNDVKSTGEHYQTPMPFFVKHGFEIMHGVRIESDMLRAVKIKWRK